MNLAVNFRLIFYMCGWVVLGLAGVMILPVIPALTTGDGEVGSFLKSAAVAAVLAGFLLVQGHRQNREDIRSRDGLATVGLAWLLIGLIGALPYWFSGSFPSFWDGLFESVSGFSTTGATAAARVETLPASIIFWRSLTNWLGGMGVIVLMLAVLPVFGLSGVQLFKHESTLGQQRVRPRIAQTAKTFWLIYAGLSLTLLLLLLAAGLGWFEALCHTLSTVATAGFSNHSLSVGYYDRPALEFILAIFIILGSLNFALYYQVARGDWKSLFRDTECRVFLLTIALSGTAVTLSLWGSGYYNDLPTTLRHAFFQVVSVISTTGLTTADWQLWPAFCQGLLFALFFVGGCSGSTSGGMKCVRWILLFKGIHRTLRQQIHPRAVIPVRLGGQAVPEDVMTAVWSFTVIYFLVLTLTTLALTALNLDLVTAFSASAAALGNVGVGLGQLGPLGSYGQFPGLAKGVLILSMFMGRLEFFSLLILFLPEFWKK